VAETYDLTLPLLARLTKIPDSLFWRQNCGTFRTMDLRRVVQATSIDGIADIMGVVRGIPVAVETKIGKGKQRVSQERFQTAFERVGGIYIVARDIEGALKAVLAL
jgi:hypothetical protein